MRSWRWTAAVAVVALMVQCYGLYRVSGPPAPPWFPQADKVEHAVGFALPAFLVLLAVARWHRARARRGPGPVGVGLILVGFVAQAVLSELIQGRFYRSRTSDPLDVVADLTGIILGWLGFRLAGRAHELTPVRA